MESDQGAVTITCMYTCNECGIYRRGVPVPARTTEEVVDWMNDVAVPLICADHASLSPFCHPTKLSELMIPVTGASKIGGPCEN
jgi:hypothetical protein